MSPQSLSAAALGEFVQYVSTKGHVKLALVIANSASLTPGTSFAEAKPLTDDQVNLLAYSPTGSVRAHYQVPSADSVKDNTDFDGGGYFLPLDVEFIPTPKVITVPDDISSLDEVGDDGPED